jgi:hypothetical protein
MCQVIMFPGSDPLDTTPLIRRIVHVDAAPKPIPRLAVMWAVILMLLLNFALWYGIAWAAVSLVGVICHALY